MAGQHGFVEVVDHFIGERMIIKVPGKDDGEVSLRFGPGDKVSMKTVPEIHAIVVGVLIRPAGALFECHWLNDSGLQAAFFSDFELEAVESGGKAGFHAGKGSRSSVKK